MKIIKYLVVVLLLVIGGYFYLHQKSSEIPEVLRKIYTAKQASKFHYISECTENRETYYLVTPNPWSGRYGDSVVYDINGNAVGGVDNKIGQSYGFSPKDCAEIYLPAGDADMSDRPRIDKYRLRWFLMDGFLSFIGN